MNEANQLPLGNELSLTFDHFLQQREITAFICFKVWKMTLNGIVGKCPKFLERAPFCSELKGSDTKMTRRTKKLGAWKKES
jgi:hypothetical protein